MHQRQHVTVTLVHPSARTVDTETVIDYFTVTVRHDRSAHDVLDAVDVSVDGCVDVASLERQVAVDHHAVVKLQTATITERLRADNLAVDET